MSRGRITVASSERPFAMKMDGRRILHAGFLMLLTPILTIAAYTGVILGRGL